MPLLLLGLWGLFAYTVLRLQFYLWNRSYFAEVPWVEVFQAFLQGLRFDFFAVGILNLLPSIVLVILLYKTSAHGEFRRRGMRWVFFPLTVLLHWPFLVFNLNDSEFIHFLGRRYTYDSLFLLKEVPGKFSELIGSYWQLNLLNLGIEIFLIWLLWRWVNSRLLELPQISKRQLSQGGILFLIVSFIAIRGGLQNKPLNFAHAQIFRQPIMNSLTMNSTFTLAQTMKRQTLERQSFMSESEMLSLLRDDASDFQASQWRDQLFPGLVHRKPNIVFIVLESFSYEFLAAGGTGKTYTPFLDELSRKSLSFENHFANARRSIEGIGALIGGVPSLMAEPFLSSQYLTNHFLGAGTLLSGAGYHTSFFHGAKNGSMYFDQFMQSAGVQKYFGKNEYPTPDKDDDGTWGIWDEPFLDFFAKKLNEFPEPFFSTIFSLSSHHPYKIPEKYIGQLPTGEAEIHSAIAYTDLALRKFFAAAAQEKWFQNTIFIITADHTFKPVDKKYQNELGNYKIPLIIYSPLLVLPSPSPSPSQQGPAALLTQRITQQIDILPTMMDLAGVPMKESQLLGKSIFATGPRWAINYSDGNYYLIWEKHREKYWGMASKTQLAEPSQIFPQVFALEDLAGAHPIMGAESENLRQSMGKNLQAMVQYFSQAMWDNKIYYPSGR